MLVNSVPDSSKAHLKAQFLQEREKWLQQAILPILKPANTHLNDLP